MYIYIIQYHINSHVIVVRMRSEFMQKHTPIIMIYAYLYVFYIGQTDS